MDAASNKRVRVGVARAVSPVTSVRKRRACADVNSRQDAAAGTDVASLEGLENATVEFTKEGVEALLNYKPKKRKFDHKEAVEETHLTEQQVLRSAFDSPEKKFIEEEIQMAKRLEELDRVIAGLRNDILFLQEQLAKESSEKLALGDEAIKQKELFVAEVRCLLEKLQQVRKDQDNQRAQVQAISTEVQKEISRK